MSDPAPPGPAPAVASGRGFRVPRRWLIIGLLAAALLVALGWLGGRQLVSSPSAGPGSRTTYAAPGIVAFRDPHGLLAGGYPASWHRLTPRQPHVVLLAAGSDGGSLLVRETPLSVPVTLANLTSARRLTDRVVHSGDNVILLRPPQQTILGNLPGYLYLYSFYDPASGARGAHAHYFLFDGRTMITLVFQALPAARIFALAGLFDRVAATFRPLRSG